MYKRCWTEIDLQKIQKNLEIYKQNLPDPIKVMGVVKADAYGHGDAVVSKVLASLGVTDFAVANIEEAVHLRQAGVTGQIIILGYTPVEDAEILEQYDITTTLVDEHYAARLAAVNPRVKAQFAVDTGMNRIGLDADDMEYCERTIRSYRDRLHLTGFFTHLCAADSSAAEYAAFTREQIQKFTELQNRLTDLQLPYTHCLNSAGGLWHQCPSSTFARLGIVLYGLKPDYTNTLPEGIEPAMTWKSVVSMVKTVRKGKTIGYGRTYTAPKDMVVATVCTGYADGYNRMLSNKGHVLIHGQCAHIVGRVCMDQFMVDVTGIPDVHMGTEVVLLGRSGDKVITADDMAEMIGTIGYEITCEISKRVERIYCTDERKAE